MKKFLVILMVVAMASFLFVGCIPSVTPTVEEEEEEEEVVAPVSATPVLTDVRNALDTLSIVTVTSTSTQYMNIAEVGSSILVKGTAPSESLVQIFLDDVVIPAAVGETATNGLWSVAVALSSLGDDGVKVLTAKVTEVGLDQSEASNAATATLDTVRPSASTLAASARTVAATTWTSAITAGVAMVDSFVVLAATGTLAAGTWTVSSVAASGTALNVCVSDGTNPLYYTVTDGLTKLVDIIPGMAIILNQSGTTAYTASGNITTLTIAVAAAVADRSTVLISEDITNASGIAIANFTFTGGVTAVGVAANAPAPIVYSSSSLTSYFSVFTTALVRNALLGCSVNGLVDLAGNIQTTASVLSATVGTASATNLAP